jgi:hypothetical protein
MNRIFKLLTILIISSCSAKKTEDSNIPSWYISPKQNDYSYFYGIAEGHSQEEATRYALADAAARLIVTISSTSNLIREENQNSVNEEMRQNVRQNVEKIDFSNFAISNSTKIGETYYAEVRIEREAFLREQKDKLDFIETKLDNLDKNSANKNPIQKRSDLIKSIALSKELEMRARILSGGGANISLKEKLNRVAAIENEMNKNLDKIEFFFEISSPKEISNIIRTALNKEKIAVARIRDPNNKNQILIKISSEKNTVKIYGSIITKIIIDFDNSLEGKSIASSNLEAVGSSVIGENESYASALKSLEEIIAKDGILKTIGILN